MAYESIYFENKRKIAEKALWKAFYAFSNCRFEKNLNEGPMRYRGRHMCACNLSQDLGEIANDLGFPDLADYFAKNTYCPEGPQYNYRKPTPLHEDFGVTGGPRFKGEEHSIEKIKGRVLSEIEGKIKFLKEEVEKEQKEV